MYFFKYKTDGYVANPRWLLLNSLQLFGVFFINYSIDTVSTAYISKKHVMTNTDALVPGIIHLMRSLSWEEEIHPC